MDPLFKTLVKVNLPLYFLRIISDSSNPYPQNLLLMFSLYPPCIMSSCLSSIYLQESIPVPVSSIITSSILSGWLQCAMTLTQPSDVFSMAFVIKLKATYFNLSESPITIGGKFEKSTAKERPLFTASLIMISLIYCITPARSKLSKTGTKSSCSKLLEHLMIYLESKKERWSNFSCSVSLSL